MEEKKSKKQEQTAEELVAKNLAIYEQARLVPESAIKPIVNGRLKGKSDINPVYRIKRMTEIFGPCGIGWRYEIVKQWLETYGNEVKAFTHINLYIKWEGEWSEAIPGIGGAAFVSMESKGAYVSDECYKMSLTDALSVSMKALGIAADIYYSKDGNNANPGDSKYRDGTINSAAERVERDAQRNETESKAVDEIRGAETIESVRAIYKGYQKTNPDICRKGGALYTAAMERANELKQTA
jgi:hypothetical protein